MLRAGLLASWPLMAALPRSLFDMSRNQRQALVKGMSMPEFEHVRREFQRNFDDRGERGAACAIYYQGQRVVDLWGGYRCEKSRDPWTEDTLVLAFSATKGMAAAVMAVAHGRGLFELNEPVAAYWPEFAQAGKQHITVRQLLSHQAGLITIDTKLNPRMIGDHDRMSEIIAWQKPAWEPGVRHGYHTLTLGWYQNELLRRVDPKHRSLGVFFQEEIARPLGVEFYIGLPDGFSSERMATTKGFHQVSLLRHLDKLPKAMVLAGIWPRSLVSKSVRYLPLRNPARIGAPEYRRVEIPSANGIGQARAMAMVYSVLAGNGHEIGISEATKKELLAPGVEPTNGIRDAILKLDTRYSFGFSRPSGDMRFGTDHTAFGCAGAGGAFAMADPTEQIGFAYLTNTMGFRIFDDPREKAVRNACYECLAAIHKRKLAA